MKRIALLVGLIAGLFFGSLVEAQSPDVYLLEYEGIVNDGMADFVARGIAEADLVNAEAVVLVLDTPGGAVDVTLDIVKTIRSSDVPVIVFVGPAGAQAASAGSVITLAGHGAVMAPETVIGAAAVVDAAGGDIGETMQAKINEDLTATMRGLTERRGEEAMALAEAMILDAEAVSASEALAIGLIDGIEADVDGVLRVMDGETVVVNGDEVVLDLGDAVRTPVETNWLEKLKLAVGDPALISLLISLGTIAIIWEVRAPGGYVAGALGVVALGLAYYGLGQVSANMLGAWAGGLGGFIVCFGDADAYVWVDELFGVLWFGGGAVGAF